ncbi:MAG: glycine betaine ABC transporter substrate-binding protein [Syntrophomonadaceae bacterium]|nr:glycine betaine ABC transporter substrate-binding protein [Syntrophomonadaceae bacterium]MDD3024359.1 glycine betaine ABC transporter substrate-binding protein [Syntrophomonadaceae bacterium]
MNKYKKFLHSNYRIGTLFLLIVCLFCLSACSRGNENDKIPANSQKSDSPIIFADDSWDSIQIHNRIAGLIIKNGYGYPVKYLSGETKLTWQALSHSDLDVIMEVWSGNNQAVWESIYKNNSVRMVGINYTGAEQGWYVPTYLVEGDVERGIEPAAPNLKSVQDLNRYAKLFADFAAAPKGIIYNSPPAWNSHPINLSKFNAYKLSGNFVLQTTGSDKELDSSLAKAYEKAQPWVGYGFSPLITAKYKMTLLKEPAFNQYQWERNQACAYPETEVAITVSRKLLDKAPELVDFLSKYKTNLEQNETVLRYLAEHDDDKDAAALYFLQQYPDVWKEWVPEAIAIKVEEALLKTTPKK